MGDGPHYTLLRNYHLCHLEVAKTVRRALEGRPPLLNNGTEPTVQVVGVAKRALAEGETLRHPMGSFDVRVVAVRIADHPDHVPIGLLDGARLARRWAAEETITRYDVDSPRAGRSRGSRRWHSETLFFTAGGAAAGSPT